MSIRPVDFNSMLPKVQELSNARQLENDKTKIQSQQIFVQQENKTNRDLSRVNDIKKNQEAKINIRDKRKENKGYKDKSKSSSENKQKHREEKNNNFNVGKNIDIKI